jgi:putative hydrolase of the HAD superfamily
VARSSISALFLDIGGVLLTNGWDRTARKLAAETFGLDREETDERHHLTFDTYEEGKLTLDEYLARVIFYRDQPFSMDEFKAFMFSRSQPYPDMIDFIRRLKARHGLKVATLSNEGRELTAYRMRTFKFEEFVDFFIASCYVHFRKPDPDIYRIALDVAQVEPERVAYIEDRPMFVEVAESLGLRGIVHKGLESTRAELEKLGLGT